MMRTGGSARLDYGLWQLPVPPRSGALIRAYTICFSPLAQLNLLFQTAYNQDPTGILRIPDFILDGRHAFDFHFHHVPSLQKFLVRISNASRCTGHDDSPLAKSHSS